MASPAVTNTFTNGTAIDASQVNTNFTDLINGLTDGTKDLSISAFTCAGTATLNGDVNLGNSSADTLSITASLGTSIPIKTTASFDIGSSTLGLRYLYLGNSTFTTRVGTGATASWNLTLPTGAGTSGYVMQTDGSGVTSWIPVTTTDQLKNATLAASASAGALTVSLKDAGGSDCSSSSPATIAFRNVTSATGTYLVRSVSAALSVVLASGGSLGQVNAQSQFIYVYAIDNAGTVELAISSTRFDDGSVRSTTAIGAGSTSASVLYSTTARTSVPIRLIGRLDVTPTTAGTNLAPTEISMWPFYGNKTEEVYVEGGNGHGSTNTKIRRFVNIRSNLGNAIIYADSSTNGGTFTIQRAGRYSVNYTDRRTAANFLFGISVNSSALTTSIGSLTYAQGRRGYSQGASGFSTHISHDLTLAAGDILYAHTDGALDATSDGDVQIHVSRLGD